MSLTVAEQICALYSTGSDIDQVVTILDCDKSYAYRVLGDAGLRDPVYNRASRIAPDAPRVNRDPCTFCNVRADIGCRHNRIAA